jgi:quinol monooxygenase YgiN
MADEIHVLTHIDLIPPNADAGTQAVEEYVTSLPEAPGFIRSQVLQQVFRKNHLELVTVWASQEAYEADLGSAHTLAFRQKLHPLIGAPFDDRLHFLLDTES